MFIIVLEALSREFREGLPNIPIELRYVDDLFSVAATEDLLIEKMRKWKKGMELKGMRVNIGKKKVMRCQVRLGIQKTIHVVFADRVLVAILLCAMRVTDGFIMGAVVAQVD